MTIRKIYKLSFVYIVVMYGKPLKQVFTSIAQACREAGLSYQRTNRQKYKDIIQGINNKGYTVRIYRAEIVKQNKGRHEDFKITKIIKQQKTI